jgi:hypothetical protein
MYGDVVWLDLAVPHNHVIVDVTVTGSARTNSNAPTVGAPLPLPYNLALGAQQAKLHADIRTSASLALARRPFTLQMTVTPSPLRMGVDWL